MKAQILQEELSKGLSTVSRFVASRPQLPILANILLVAEKGKLRLSATNLDLGINLWLGGKIEKEGLVAIPAREITEFVSYLNPGSLNLELDKNLLVISSATNKASFVGMNGKEFPKIPQLEKETAFPLSLEQLSQTVGQVGFAAAVDEARPVLEGIYWQFEDKSYQMVATDGYRLSLKKVDLEKAVASSKKKTVFLIPARSLSEVVKLSDGETIQVGLTKDKNQVVFGFSQGQISSRLLEGEFPEYGKIIPQQAKTKVWLDKQDFLGGVKAASVFAREAANIVILDIDKKEVKIKADAPQVGENQSSVAAKVEGEPIKVAFNFRFLLDFLNAVPQGENNLLFEFTEPLSPALFKFEGDKSWLHVIMPVRLEDLEK